MDNYLNNNNNNNDNDNFLITNSNISNNHNNNMYQKYNDIIQPPVQNCIFCGNPNYVIKK